MKPNLQYLLELCSQIVICRELQEAGGWMSLLGEMDAHREIVRIMATDTSHLPKMIDINCIEVSKDRRPVAFEDAKAMADSIREHGLIQPIVLSRIAGDEHAVGERYKLVAGNHRLSGLRILGRQFLKHFEDYIVRGEDATTPEGQLRLAAVELEENIRRKELTWAEQIEQKAKLLELMEKIHGESRGFQSGRPTNSELRKNDGFAPGFGIRRLAAMLGESVGTVSQDLQLARMVRAMPALAMQESKSAATRVGTMGVALQMIKQQAATKQATTPASQVENETPKFELYEGKWEDNIASIPDLSIDLIYTDLPYGVNLDQMGSHVKGAITYDDPRIGVVSMLPRLLNQAFRILKDNRYAIFWFGFNYYTDLIEAVKHAGFAYNPVPFVWLKHRQAGQDPLTRYANGYEQCLICWKGNARFIRPGQVNIADIPAVAVGEKLQNAQQPIPLVERFIKDMLLPGSMARVLDFTCGTGTTGVAAIMNGHYPILFERDANQCLIAKQRLQNVKVNATATASLSAASTSTGK